MISRSLARRSSVAETEISQSEDLSCLLTASPYPLPASDNVHREYWEASIRFSVTSRESSFLRNPKIIGRERLSQTSQHSLRSCTNAAMRPEKPLDDLVMERRNRVGQPRYA